MNILIFVAVLCGVCNGYNILVVFPFAGTSHSFIMGSCVEILLKAGHEVTYITPVSQNIQHVNLTKIDVNRNKKLKKLAFVIKDFIGTSERPNFVKVMYAGNLEMSVSIFKDPEVVALVHSKAKFDVVIVEWLFGELLAGFSAIFECPLVWVSPLDPHWMILSLVDGATNPAYVPAYNSFSAPPFNFLERVEQLWLQTHAFIFRYIAQMNAEREYQRVVVPLIKRSPPSFHELIHNGSLVIGFTNSLVGQPTNLPQIYKQLGGYHIGEVEILPDDVKKLMDNAKHGVIYFSLGTVLDSSDLPQHIKEDLLKLFGQLEQTVIWKCHPFADNLPENVHIMEWAPQLGIMAHPNLLFIITHGGLLSTLEALHFGVPLIGIPAMADQYLNVHRAVDRGLGLKVDLNFSMAEDLKAAVLEMLGNYPSYSKKVKEYSAIYHDRLVSPQKELTYWIEHVVTSGGAPHLRSPALFVPYHQMMYLDLIGILLVLLICVKMMIKLVLSTRQVKVTRKLKRS